MKRKEPVEATKEVPGAAWLLVEKTAQREYFKMIVGTVGGCPFEALERRWLWAARLVGDPRTRYRKPSAACLDSIRQSQPFRTDNSNGGKANQPIAIVFVVTRIELMWWWLWGRAGGGVI